jgi:hypothetical protein
MDRQFQNGGALFVREKRNPNAADYGGDFTIDADVLSYVENCIRRGDPVKLEISGWKRQGRNDTQFISLSINTPYEYRQNNQQSSHGRDDRGSADRRDDRRDERRDDRNSYGSQSRGEYRDDRGRGQDDRRDRRPQERNGWDD